MHFEQTCAFTYIVWPSVGPRVKTRGCISRQEDVFRANFCCLLNYKAFVGRGLRLKDLSRGKKVYCEPNLCWFLLNCKAFGGSRVKTRRCISRQEVVF